ncbi:MAG: lysophospholipid acyltransferase family protein [Terriglobia bacterium]
MRGLAETLGLLRSLLLTLPLIYLVTLLLGLAWLLALPFDRARRGQHGWARWWGRLLLAIGGVRVRVHGLENLETGAHYVFLANHQSYMDVPVVLGHVPGGFGIMAKAALFPIPLVGWWLRQGGHLPIESNNPRADARRLLQAIRYVREGHSLFVFPEGGRSVSGAVEPFKPGIFLAALKAGVPIVPVTLKGTRALLARGSFTLRPGRVDLLFASPIATAGLQRSELEALIARVHRCIDDSFRRVTS